MGRYTGKVIMPNTYNVKYYGPLDTRLLVPTYDDLTLASNWTINGYGSTAYNGMIVAVGSDVEDTSRNGVYYLFDINKPKASDEPDVTSASNWHKLATLDDLEAAGGTGSGIDEAAVNALIDARIDALKAEFAQAGYLTEADLEGYATETFVTTKIAEAQLSGEEVDLSGYATKDDLNIYAKTEDIEANYATKAQSDKNLITADKIKEVDTIHDFPNVGDGNCFYVAKDTGYTYIYDSKEVSFKKFAINENYTIKTINGGDASSVYGA